MSNIHYRVSHSRIVYVPFNEVLFEKIWISVIKKIVFSSKKNYRHMAFRMASNQFRRSAMKSRNFASAAAASEKGFVEKFVPVEVRNFPR